MELACHALGLRGQVTFLLRPSNSDIRYRIFDGLVEAAGIEPASASDPQLGATFLVSVLVCLCSFQ